MWGLGTEPKATVIRRPFQKRQTPKQKFWDLAEVDEKYLAHSK
jgi:hypothetical protein